MRAAGFAARGWCVFPPEPAVSAWVDAARPVAEAALADPAQSHHYACGGTWFVGVDALPNDAAGRIGAGPPLAGRALDFIAERTGPIPPLHRGQLSVTFPGYPQPRAGEGEAAFRYRQRRDAAHVDGLLPVGPDRKRMVREPHLFILGLPLDTAPETAAPLVVWEGSHRIMRRAFRAALADVPPDEMAERDVTAPYQTARRDAFDTCPRVPVTAPPGAAILLDRHLLHGIAPWSAGAGGRRAIAYFRPIDPGGVAAWVDVQ